MLRQGLKDRVLFYSASLAGLEGSRTYRVCVFAVVQRMRSPSVSAGATMTLSHSLAPVGFRCNRKPSTFPRRDLSSGDFSFLIPCRLPRRSSRGINFPANCTTSFRTAFNVTLRFITRAFHASTAELAVESSRTHGRPTRLPTSSPQHTHSSSPRADKR